MSMFKSELKYTDDIIEFDNIITLGDEHNKLYYAVKNIGDIETDDYGVHLKYADVYEIDIDTLEIIIK